MGEDAAPLGYWIGHITVTDPEEFARYPSCSEEAIAAFGGRFLARGGVSDNVEGMLGARHVIVEFPSLEIARTCYASSQYKAAQKIRNANADSQVAIVEGV